MAKELVEMQSSIADTFVERDEVEVRIAELLSTAQETMQKKAETDAKIVSVSERMVAQVVIAPTEAAVVGFRVAKAGRASRGRGLPGARHADWDTRLEAARVSTGRSCPSLACPASHLGRLLAIFF